MTKATKMKQAGRRRVSYIATALGNPALVVAVLAALALGREAEAISIYGVSGGSGGFSVACSGPSNGGLPNAGVADNRIFFQPAASCTTDPLTPAASSSFTSGNVSASSMATSALGSASGTATMSTDLQNSITYPVGFTDSGWLDTIVIEDAAHDGQLAMVSIILNVSGNLSISGPNASASLLLYVRAANTLVTHAPLYGISTPSSTLAVNDTLILDLPFTIGTPSEFMVRAMARAGTTSDSSLGNNTAHVDHMVTWGGIDHVTVGGNEISSYTALGVTSGIDWAAPVPEPSTALLLGLGVGVLLTRQRPAR